MKRRRLLVLLNIVWLPRASINSVGTLARLEARNLRRLGRLTLLEMEVL